MRQRSRSILVQAAAGARGRGWLMLADRTGIKFPRDGESLAKKHGTHRRRRYRKVPLAMDAASGDIRGVEFTPRDEEDSPVLPDRPNATGRSSARPTSAEVTAEI